jgi:hypothetical protein
LLQSEWLVTTLEGAIMRTLARTLVGLIAAATLVVAGSAIATAAEAPAQLAGNCGTCL